MRGILDFPEQFRHRDGRPGDVLALSRVRRFGPRLLLASQRVASRIPLTGSIDGRARHAFTHPQSVTRVGRDRVEVLTYDTERAEVERVADLLRRAHLEDGVAWSQMAVLVRSGRTSIPLLRRGLAGAGVPVEVASDETPLVREPAVRPLLDALRAVVNLDNDDPADPDHLDPVAAEGLLVSPMVGPRRHRRTRAVTCAARARQAARPRGGTQSPALAAPAQGSGPRHRCGPGARSGPAPVTAGLDPVVRRVAELSALLRKARAQLDASGTVEEVLWTLWSGTAWPELLRARTRRGGTTARLADRDLDAMCALFETAARAEEQVGHKSVGEFLATIEAQEIPADTLAERGIHGESVRLLTAHRSKGLEWQLVVVAHVQEGAWPDLRRRASLLQADRIGAEKYAVPVLQPDTTTRELLAEERRLFYVACTRARERLVVTAVASPDDEGEQPSRFLTELGVGAPPPPGASATAAVAPRPGQRAAPHRSRPGVGARTPRRGCAQARAAQRRASPRRSSAGAGRRSRDLVGHPGPEPGRRARAPGGPADRAVGQRPRGARRVPREVVPRARGRGSGEVQPGAGLRKPGARDRRPGGQGRARLRRRRRGRADGARRRRVAPARVPHPVVAGAGARRGAQGTDPVRRVARPTGRAHGAAPPSRTCGPR